MKDAETGPRQTGPHTSVPDWPVDHGASCPHANLTTCSTCNILHIIHTSANTHTYNTLCNILHIIQAPTNMQYAISYTLYILQQILNLIFKSTKEVSALTPTVPSLKTCPTCKIPSSTCENFCFTCENLHFHQRLQFSFFLCLA